MINVLMFSNEGEEEGSDVHALLLCCLGVWFGSRLSFRNQISPYTKLQSTMPQDPQQDWSSVVLWTHNHKATSNWGGIVFQFSSRCLGEEKVCLHFDLHGILVVCQAFVKVSGCMRGWMPF